MARIIFFLYVVAELVALFAIGSALGVGWTIVLILAISTIGLFLARSQWSQIVQGFRLVSRGETSPAGVITDSAYIALGTALLVVPGFITSVLGFLLLIPATRVILRPFLSFLALRRGGPRFAFFGTVGSLAATVFEKNNSATKAAGDYIEGEVIDSTVRDSPALGDTSLHPHQR